MQALDAALRLGALPGPPVLFRLPDLPPIVQETYAAAADFAEVRTLPWDAATPDRPFPPAGGFARVIDIRDFAFDPAFRGVAMIDYFLRQLGLDPAGVPAELRRNAWLAPRVAASAWPELPAGYVLVCPRTSMALRTMPDTIYAAILDELATSQVPVVSQGAPHPGVVAAPPASTFASLCGLVAGARAMISADTAMPHLADAFGVPCLALFTTHRPEWRVRDYKLCRSIHLPSGLPDALEFARDPSDEAAARAAWFPQGGDLTWLASPIANLLRRAGLCRHKAVN